MPPKVVQISSRHSFESFSELLMSPKIKIAIHDLLAIALAWVGALWVRFNFEVPPAEFIDTNFETLPAVIIVQGLIFNAFHLYRGQWRFASVQDLMRVVGCATLGSMSLGLAALLFQVESIPRSMFLLFPIFLIFILGGSRLVFRLWKDRELGLLSMRFGERVLIVGAGIAGEGLLRELRRSQQYLAVGFVDDNPSLLSSRIHGLPVLGGVEDITNIVTRLDIHLVIIAVPSANAQEMQRIVQACALSGADYRTLPKLLDLVDQKVGLEKVREVAIDDLLGREKIQLDWDKMQNSLSSSVILVTGGGGSVGIELCRQLCRLGISRLVVFDNSELNLYQAEREIRNDYPDIESIFMLGDVRDTSALDFAFEKFNPAHVFHAAAYKHVPILEKHTREAISNNILGTRNVADLASAHNCDSFVLISSDKAVNPSSVMGATKRFAEMLCVHKNEQSDTNYITVRFGNVLGSTGSVVPLFQSQISEGGPVTVTHPEATRYFMAVSEACQLILEASVVGLGGEVFVLDMGNPIKITFLAEQVIRLSGHVPNKDIKIVYTGLRGGEKINEELFYEHESPDETSHEKLLLASHKKLEEKLMSGFLDGFKDAVDCYDEDECFTLLSSFCPSLRETSSELSGFATEDSLGNKNYEL
jgi:FlaA1/EpsC-like NDP-sugar epimerase